LTKLSASKVFEKLRLSLDWDTKNKYYL
jgi:hypothetical protein